VSERRCWGNPSRQPRPEPGAAGSELVGWIALVAEDRFRVIDDLGRGYLLTLSRRAGVAPDALHRWAEEGRRVCVCYHGAPDLGALATRVRPLDGD
jgi:hypothetical protein